ncbi:MAG: Lrp/AsnC family transcriptional regulator [Flavobacteriales bacterium]|nr:Lrp/AsnC family transcriptional regulator [Flavobacteriales bacterium]
MKKIDQIDAQILELLQKDGRITVKELASKLGRSTTPIFERVKKLENSGVIAHYAAVVDADKLGKKLYAFAHISLKDHSKDLVEEFTSAIIKIPQIQECHYVTGDSDFILKILLNDMEKYREFMMDQLFDMSNIAKVESFLSLSVLKKSNFVAID